MTILPDVLLGTSMLIVLISAFGVVYQGWSACDAVAVWRAMRRAGVGNGRLDVARGMVYGNLSFWAVLAANLLVNGPNLVIASADRPLWLLLIQRAGIIIMLAMVVTNSIRNKRMRSRLLAQLAGAQDQGPP